MVEQRKKRKADELSNPTAKPVRKEIGVQNQSPFQVLLSSLSTSSPPSSFSFWCQIQELLPPPSPLSTSSVTPSSSSHICTHDVFPSFRGEDVRSNFLSHVKKEFQRQGITLFNDNGIKRGESIGPELIRAIKGSKIAIVLLSNNYASSTWCLEELVEIMKCKEELRQTVMVIFYKVDPSNVKKLTGKFGKVFKKTCVGKTEEDVGRWRQALEKVATIAGYPSRNWKDEAAMIEKIATDVLKKLLYTVPSSDFDGFVGMGAHMVKMEPFLRIGSDEVRMIGIWGPSGIGKSTIARALSSKYSHQFQLSVFMENIKSRCSRPCYDEYSAKLKLQKEFWPQLMNHEDINIHHLGVAPDRLKYKRVFVVLDDVDHLMQLDALAKEDRWFGPGSRIIITTQDKRLLKAHGIKHIYEVEFPPGAEALEIFCMYAFDQNYPYEGFEKLAWEVTRLAGKLPWALRVMGSYLKGIPKEKWEEELPRLRTRLDGETESVLKFSYDALCDEDQALFLHIACLFNKEPIEKVEACLAENFSGVKGGLRVLAEKSLISIGPLGCIEMHDLLQRLGREIVRKSINEPGKRQFLVDGREICQVLRNDSVGSPSVIGIDLDYSELGMEYLKISDGAFERMSSVQFLRLRSSKGLLHWDYFPMTCPSSPIESLSLLDWDDFYETCPFSVIGSLSLLHSDDFPKTCLPPKLRLLHWEYFPKTCLPCNFNPEFLVELKMPSSKLEKLWEGIKMIRNLKWMDLSHSENLKELPDLSNATNLRELNLSYCSSLMELPSSIRNAINLPGLNLCYCSSLMELPSFIGNMASLTWLSLNRCSSLVELPSSIGNLTNLTLEGCSSLVELPSSIGNITNLTLEGCSSLVELPSSIGDMASLTREGCSSHLELSSSIEDMASLTLEGCSSLVELPSSIGNMASLTWLSLKGCSSLVELPSSIGNMASLTYLSLKRCSSLVELPSFIGNLHNLEKLYLKGCSKLKSLPININMRSLDQLDLSDCSSLKSFPEISTNIRRLILKGTAIERIPPCVKEMSRLYKLVIEGCTKLVSLSQLPNSLAILYAENCESLERLDCSFSSKEFRRLKFVNCFKLNQEARDLIIKTSTTESAAFPGETVPTYFTYRASGSSLSMKLNGSDTFCPTSLRFKACVLLDPKGDVEDDDMAYVIYCKIEEKLNGGIVVSNIPARILIKNSPPSKEHLYVFEFEKTVSSTELVFEFEVSNPECEIKECGIRTPETYAPSC